jgi:hypothetical protein
MASICSYKEGDVLCRCVFSQFGPLCLLPSNTERRTVRWKFCFTFLLNVLMHKARVFDWRAEYGELFYKVHSFPWTG